MEWTALWVILGAIMIVGGLYGYVYAFQNSHRIGADAGAGYVMISIVAMNVGGFVVLWALWPVDRL